MKDLYQQEAFSTLIIKHLIIPFKSFKKASTFDVKLSNFEVKKNLYLLFELSYPPLKLALLKNEYSIKYKKSLNTKGTDNLKPFELLYSIAELTGQKCIIEQRGEVEGKQIPHLMNNPKKVNYIIENNGKREFVSCVLESNLLKQVATLLPQNREVVKNYQGQYLIKTEKYAASLPLVTGLLFNPFYFPASTFDILNKYLNKHYIRIIQQFFKYKVFNPYYLKPILKLPLGDFCGYLVENIKQMKSILTYNDNLFDDNWFAFFLSYFLNILIFYTVVVLIMKCLIIK